MESCATAEYTVSVIPDEAIHVELLWDTPGDPDQTDTGAYAGADLDLHFLHPDAPSDADAPDLDDDGAPDPYFDSLLDCYWLNPHPDWGEIEGTDGRDDPGLDRDDTDGAGPENLNLASPEDGARYEVAVSYRNDHGYGSSYATVRVYIRGGLAWESASVRLVSEDLWSVCTIDWPSGTVTAVLEEGGAQRITPSYHHPRLYD